jgi:hypothetical protein
MSTGGFVFRVWNPHALKEMFSDARYQQHLKPLIEVQFFTQTKTRTTELGVTLLLVEQMRA